MADTAREAVDLSLSIALQAIEAHVEELGALDAAAGDGDHGTTMLRGLRAANDAIGGLDVGASASTALIVAGSAFSDAAGGASGALVGALLLTTGRELGDGPYDGASVHRALEVSTASVSAMGKAQVGDKTLLDALIPFVDALGKATAAGMDIVGAWKDGLVAAEAGAAATAGMIARKGRASRLGERSREGLDPGAISMCYILRAAGEALTASCPRSSL